MIKKKKQEKLINKIKIIMTIIILIFVFLLNLISGEVQSIPPVKLNECVNLPQIVSNSTQQNITIIQSPNKTLYIINAEMTSLGGGYYNYSFCQNIELGNWIVNGIGDDDGELIIWNYDYWVTPDGTIPTEAQGWFSIGLLVSIMVLSFFFGIAGFKFSNYNRLAFMGLFFILISFLLAIYSLYLGLIFSRDYLYPTTAVPQSTLFIAILYSLLGCSLILLLFLTWDTIYTFKQTAESRKMGEGWNSEKKMYEY